MADGLWVADANHSLCKAPSLKVIKIRQEEAMVLSVGNTFTILLLSTIDTN